MSFRRCRSIRLLGGLIRLRRRTSGRRYRSFLGAGAYRHYVPPAIPALAMRGEFLTAYTPYQAEVSQGYLQAIYEWQTYICLLTGMDIANASVYDGATALAEGAIMALNANGRKKVLVSRAIHPNYRAVLQTYCDGLDVDGRRDRVRRGRHDRSFGAARCALRAVSMRRLRCSRPNFFGNVDTLDAASQAAVRESGTVPIAVVAEALSMAALATPASWGAEIVVGEAQSFGVAIAYGGPYAGFIASTQEHMRRIPGRLVGRSVDSSGRTAFVLTLQAREQHIRRERATSNICTNQAHCALIATMYLALMGKTGLRDVAALNLRAFARTRDRGVERARHRPEVLRAVLQRVRCRRASAGRGGAREAARTQDPGRSRSRTLLSRNCRPAF